MSGSVFNSTHICQLCTVDKNQLYKQKCFNIYSMSLPFKTKLPLVGLCELSFLLLEYSMDTGSSY